MESLSRFYAQSRWRTSLNHTETQVVSIIYPSYGWVTKLSHGGATASLPRRISATQTLLCSHGYTQAHITQAGRRTNLNCSNYERKHRSRTLREAGTFPTPDIESHKARLRRGSPKLERSRGQRSDLSRYGLTLYVNLKSSLM